jgi:hypothetical protein
VLDGGRVPLDQTLAHTAPLTRKRCVPGGTGRTRAACFAALVTRGSWWGAPRQRRLRSPGMSMALGASSAHQGNQDVFHG